MAQNPEITYINSLEVWNRLGRSVNRDENGMKIRVSDTYVKDESITAIKSGVCSTFPRPTARPVFRR